jgi:hypothetical protein
MYLNQLTIIGFTGQDADFHYTPNGTAVQRSQWQRKSPGRMTTKANGRAEPIGTAS